MATRRYSPFAEELGNIPLDGGGVTVSATLAGTWGGWTAASAASVTPRIEATLAASWGGWTAASAATVTPRIEAALDAAWGAWNAQMAATIPAAPTISAVLDAAWGAWSANLTATVIPRIESVLAASWGAWTAASAATVTPRIESVLTATWGGWTASMAATRIGAAVSAVLAATWGGWTAQSFFYVRPLNDAFADAFTIVPGVPTTGTTVGATVEVDERPDADGTSRGSVWWVYTTDGPEIITLTTLGSAADTWLSVFTGPDVSHLTLVAENDDIDYDGGIYESEVVFAATGDTTYYIRITSYGEDTIALSLEVEALPPVLAAAWGGWYLHSYARPHTPPRSSPLVPYSLGCGIYEAYIKTRGGYVFVGRARNITGGKWSRVLNDVSEAEITFALNGIEGECCDLAATINPWEHELSIYRDGEEVWCGPVTGGSIDLSENTATFTARDLSAWFDHRLVEVMDNEVEFDEVDITVLFEWLLSHGYWKDPFNLEWFVGDPLGVPITRTYVEYSAPERWGGVYQNVASELRDLVSAKIDFTTIRRVLIAGDLQTGTAAAPIQLLDQDWTKLPNINIVGTSMATWQAVAGGNGGNSGYGDDQMWIEKPYDADRVQFGLLQSLDTAPELDDIDTYDLPNPISQRAYEFRELRRKPFVYLSGGTISRHAPVTFDQLIPGRHFRIVIDQTCRTVRSNYLLTRTDTTFGDDGEDVTLELVPPGIDMLKGTQQ